MPGITIQNFHSELKKVGRGIKKLRFFKFADLRRVFGVFSRKEKIAVIALLAILLMDVLISGSRFYISRTTAVPAYGGSYAEGILGEPRFINPVLAQSQADKDLTHLVYAGLYKYDNSGNLIPDLADGPLQLSQDQKQYTIKLKNNLKWHDGRTITADDVIFTVQLLQNPDYKSPFRRLWQNIQIQKIDDLTVKFTNQDISSPFQTNLTLGILPAHIWQNISPDNFYLAKQNLEPIGSGPYFINEISKSVNGDVRSITFSSYSNYALGKPYIDKVVLKFYPDYDSLLSGFHTKEVDSIGFTPFDKKIFVDLNRSGIAIKQLPLYQYQALFFNQSKNKIFGDRTVRIALAQSLNRDAFIKNVYSGLALPAYTPILPGQVGFDENITKQYNLDQNVAAQNFDNAGWIKDPNSGMRSKGGQPLKFTITTNDFVLNVKSAEELQQQWKQIGADVSVNVVPTVQFEKDVLRGRNYEALLFSESTGADPDPFAFWHSSQSANPGFNLALYGNVAADRLISDARSTFDPNVRAQKYADFQKVFVYDMPAIIIDQSVFVYEMRPNIKGINIKYLAVPEDRFYDIQHWFTQTRRTFTSGSQAR